MITKEGKVRAKKKNFQFMIGGVLLLLLLLFLNVVWCLVKSPRQELLRPHIIVDSNGLEKVWSLSNIFIPSSSINPLMAGFDKKLFIIGDFSRPGIEHSRLLALNASDGTFLWRNWRPGGDYSVIFSTPTALYAGLRGRAKVEAYDLHTGEILWLNQLPLARNVARLTVDDDLIYVKTNKRAHVLQADTGEILKGIWPPAWFLNGGLLVEDKVIFQDAMRTNVRVIRHPSGGLVWEAEVNAVSNVVATETTAYLLTLDGKLLGFDLETGETITLLQFDPPSLPHTDPDRKVNVYYVAMDKEAGLLYAYLGDSAQLFAFKIVDNPAD